MEQKKLVAPEQSSFVREKAAGSLGVYFLVVLARLKQDGCLFDKQIFPGENYCQGEIGIPFVAERF